MGSVARRLPAARTSAGNFKQPTRQLVIEWVSQAWHEVPHEIIVKSFKRCGISNALDGTEDSEIRVEIPKDIEEEPIEDQEEDDDEEFDPFNDDD